MLLAIVFGVIAVACFVFAVLRLFQVLRHTRQGTPYWRKFYVGQLGLILLILVFSAIGLWQSLTHLGLL